MFGENSFISVDTSDFSMNSASGSGGAIYVDGSVSINESTVSNNTALTGEGGVIVSSGQNANVSLVQSTLIFSHNMAPSCGVLTVQDLHHLVSVIRSSFMVTDHIKGGGVTCVNSASISVINSSFLHDSANFYGGVLLIHDSGIIIEDSLFFNNSASEDGGVIYTNTMLLALSIICQCTFIQNTAGSDEGMLFSGSQLSVSRSTFSNNNATSRGGAIRIIGGTVQKSMKLTSTTTLLI